jgi:2-hydroxychromene-2-carboxylate isomerase
MSTPTPDAAFYFDLASPQAYLVAERIRHQLGPIDWTPVLARELPGKESLDRAEIELCAAQHGLLPIRWPAELPFDSALAMLAATYAKSIGRGVPFAQAAFRQAFAAGRSLAQADNVAIAAAACEMHPRAILQGTRLDSIRTRLHANTTSASDLGVSYVPAVRIGEHVFAGERSLQEAVASLSLPGSEAARIGVERQ